jgi:hypothetical protein
VSAARRRLAGAVALVAVVGVAAAPASRAQASGTTAAAILDIPATARAVGLGGAYTAVVGDAGSIFANPAGLAPIGRVALGVSYQRYLLGAYLVSGAAALRVGAFDVGLGVHVLNFGQDTVYRPDPAFGGERGIADPGGAMAGAYDAVAVGTLVYRTGMLSVGGNVKYLKQQLSIPDTMLYDASGFGFDVGTAAAFFDIAAIGVVVQNLGRDLRTSTGTAAPLPRTVRAGLTLNVVDPQGTPRLMLVTDWVSPRGRPSYWIFAAEGGVVSGGIGLLGRVGIATADAPADRRTLVFGGSLVFHRLRLDYGYQGFDALGGATQRFGLEWQP